MKNIGIIPARCGSKSIIDKNIKPLAGKPLMAYSIEAALDSEEFDTVMVSTDSNEYADIASEYGADVPFIRSVINSSDLSSSWNVVEEVLLYYIKKGITFDTFCLLQPTSPLRDSEDIKKAYKYFKQKNALSVISVCKAEYMPTLCNVLPPNKAMEHFFKNSAFQLRRQDADEYYRVNGAIYISDVRQFLCKKNIYETGSYAYEMDRSHSIDIDEEIDFKYAEFLLNFHS